MAKRLIAIDGATGVNNLREWDETAQTWSNFSPYPVGAGHARECEALWATEDEIIFHNLDGTFYHLKNGVWSTTGIFVAAENCRAVSGTGNDNVWFHGDKCIWHWNGAAWTTWTIASIGAGGGYYYDIYSASASDVWICAARVLLHYDGAAWSANLYVTLPPSITTASKELRSLYGVSGSSIYLAEWSSTPRGIVRYDGSVWADNGTIAKSAVHHVVMPDGEIVLSGSYIWPNYYCYSGPSMGAWAIEGPGFPVSEPHGIVNKGGELFAAFGDPSHPGKAAIYTRDVAGVWSALPNSSSPYEWHSIAVYGSNVLFVTVQIEEGYGSGFVTVFDGYNFQSPYDSESSIVRSQLDGYDGYNFTIKRDVDWVLGRISIDATIDGYEEDLVNISPTPLNVDVSRSTSILFRVNVKP